MEYDVKLPELGNVSMADFWKPILTQPFIEDVKKSGRSVGKSGKYGYSAFVRLETRGKGSAG